MSGYVYRLPGWANEKVFPDGKQKRWVCQPLGTSLVNVFDESISSLSIQFFCLLISQIIIQKRVCDSFGDSATYCWWRMTAFYSRNWHTMGKRKEKELARICNELANLCNQTCPWDCNQMLFPSRSISHRRIIELFEMCHWHSMCSTYFDSGLKVTYSELRMSLELTRICFRMNPQDYQQIVWHGIGLCLHFSIKEASSVSEFIANRFPFFKSRWRWSMDLQPSAETSSGINEKYYLSFVYWLCTLKIIKSITNYACLFNYLN